MKGISCLLHRFVDSGRRNLDACFGLEASARGGGQIPLGLVVLPLAEIERGLSPEFERSHMGFPWGERSGRFAATVLERVQRFGGGRKRREL